MHTLRNAQYIGTSVHDLSLISIDVKKANSSVVAAANALTEA